jgi:hypothetical protein
MSKVISDMSMSLDGLMTGSNDGVELPLGDGGERLHEWVYGLASWRERHGLAAAVVGDRFYLLGGSSRAGAIENEGRVMIYSP